MSANTRGKQPLSFSPQDSASLDSRSSADTSSGEKNVRWHTSWLQARLDLALLAKSFECLHIKCARGLAQNLQALRLVGWTLEWVDSFMPLDFWKTVKKPVCKPPARQPASASTLRLAIRATRFLRGPSSDTSCGRACCLTRAGASSEAG